MGISSDGILVFGIDLGEETPGFLYKDEDTEFDEFGEFLLHEAGEPRWDHEDYNVYKARLQRVQEEVGVELVMHCSYDYPMYILAVPGTYRSANRGYAVPIAKDDILMNQLVGIDKLRAFCNKYGIDWVEPQWLLCSMYG
jgi:hypothetical protein